MAEWDLIQFIRNLAGHAAPDWLKVVIGDDAAVVAPPAGRELVVTTDMLIEGTHFRPDAPPEQVGYKAVARCLSDLAAMAARPLCTVAAVAFGPAGDAETARRISRALWDAAQRLGAPLVGGDVSSTSGPLNVSVTALGAVRPGGAILRSGARPGDAVCVTGRLGGSLRGRHLTFTPRIAEALELAERCEVHAMIDVSDGLSTDALHIAEESGVGLALRAEAIPVSDDAVAASCEADPPDCPLRHALNDGEDYELLFCVSEADAGSVAATGLAGTPVSIIGQVTSERKSFLVLPDGSREALRSGGWEHQTG